MSYIMTNKWHKNCMGLILPEFIEIIFDRAARYTSPIPALTTKNAKEIFFVGHLVCIYFFKTLIKCLRLFK